ncbi:MAG TPA: DUF6438 domain-containing protein [Caulobacteraceae bacterium]|nr:DUF6438 domain-containing protein [Caulobacteraceae bacterium]
MRPALAALLLIGLVSPVPAKATASDFRIVLNRSACFGACPDYTVTVEADGQVTFSGRRFVSCIGETHWRVPRAQVRALETRVERMRFFDLKSEYRAHVTDLPTQTITVRSRGRTQTVVDYGGRMAGMPKSVSDLEVLIDQRSNDAACRARDARQSPP